MWTVLSLALAAPPDVFARDAVVMEAPVGDVVLSGTEQLHVTRDGRTTVFDFTDQVHVPGEPDAVSLLLVDADASANADRVVSLWLVRTEEAEHAAVTAWVGVLEPARSRLAGFPLDKAPRSVAISGDGEVVAWAWADAVHVTPVLAPPRPVLEYEIDVDPPLFDKEPVLMADLDLLDGWAFDVPDLSLELFDWVDLEIPILEDPPLVLDDPKPAEPPPRGAQRLTPQPIELKTPSPGFDPVVALSEHGRIVAVAGGPELALWQVGSTAEARWTGALDAEVRSLRFDGPVVVATLTDGRTIRVGVGGPVDLTAKR